jgi:hypothetical protein
MSKSAAEFGNGNNKNILQLNNKKSFEAKRNL